jgi:ribonuclease I
LEPRFERQWPSFKKTEDDFLDHEWIEHGNCARPIINDEHSYFKTTLDLDLKYDLNRYLKAAGIYPSDTSTYRIETLLKAFDDGVGLDGSTQLQCKDGELVEVYVCLSKDLTEAIVCPKPPPPDNYCSEMLLPKTLGGSKRADATSLEASSGPAPVASA